MRRESSTLWTTILLTLALCFAGAAGAAEANVSISPSLVSWESAPGFQLTLSVSGPGDLYYREAFDPGVAPQFGLSSDVGDYLADGVYTWELTASPVKAAKRAGELGDLSAVKGFVSSGYFTIAGGTFVDSLVPEAGGEKDIVHLDDVIIDFSLCVGNDCVNGENFGFDTVRLKENNLRIHFDDTSNSASFPANDWRITVNGSNNGDQSYFRIDDATAGRSPFTIEAGASNNALYVEADSDIGIGTNNPVVELHIKDGDSPTLRLEQDGSSGFTPQTWDLAGNETNFFVRDATNGSLLPFKIKPGADTNSLFIAADGDIGLGTQSPSAKFHIENNSGGDFVVTSASDLGIGTTIPDYDITVERSASAAQIRLTGTGTGIFQQATDAPSGEQAIQTNISSSGVFKLRGVTDNLASVTVPGITLDLGTGNVGIGLSNPTGNELELGSGARVVGGVWTNASSRAYKTDITSLTAEQAATALAGLEPVSYRHKKDLGEQFLGFIAEDVPELVAMSDRKGLATMDIVAVLTKVLQEQQRTIEQLTSRVGELEKAAE